MLINEVCQMTSLTKKAVQYYIEAGLVCPSVLENGYRDFTESDVERLKKIAALRKLGLSALDIKSVLSDETGEALRKSAVQKRLDSQRAQEKNELLDKLSANKLSFSELSAHLEALEQNATIAEKLLDAFPGYFGRFISMHFARFLNEPITTHDQKLAYGEITAFLDGVPELVFPEDVKAYWGEATGGAGADIIGAIQEGSLRALGDIEAFLDENNAMLDEYLEFKLSGEYKASLPGRLEALLKEFCTSSGYYGVFIPAMKRLSPAYATYLEQMEAANEKLLARYPEIAVGANCVRP